jgi:hypothetical protein
MKGDANRPAGTSLALGNKGNTLLATEPGKPSLLFSRTTSDAQIAQVFIFT